MNSVRKFSAYLLVLFSSWLVIASGAQASLFGQAANPFGSSGPVDVEEAFVFGFVQEDDNRLQLNWTMPDDYYLYRDRMEIKTGDNIKLVERVNAPAKSKDDPLFGNVWVYYDRAEVDLTLSSAADTPADGVLEGDLSGVLGRRYLLSPGDQNSRTLGDQ